MSKQWGHGFHKGVGEGFDRGTEVGFAGGAMNLGEHCWHCVNASITAIQNDNEMEALGILRTLRYMLAASTGRELSEQGKEVAHERNA